MVKFLRTVEVLKASSFGLDSARSHLTAFLTIVRAKAKVGGELLLISQERKNLR